MKTLTVTQLKPNPTGKDRAPSGPISHAQLAAEWVDFANTGNAGADLKGVELYHLAFSASKPNGEWELVMNFQGVLEPGKVVRIHSGFGPESVIRPEDRSGAHYHLFTGRDRYIWNNREGDTAGLWDKERREWIDRASYDSYPPEGVILVRSGDKLVAPGYEQRRVYR